MKGDVPIKRVGRGLRFRTRVAQRLNECCPREPKKVERKPYRFDGEAWRAQHWGQEYE